MLTEYFIASVGVPLKPPGTNVAKDAAIFLHEYQPLSQQRAIYKKSATPPNCLAVSERHIFAAQSDKGVVHVYDRQKGNQTTTVPFPDKISSVTLACDDSVLILGTVEGKIFLWETFSGRQVTTPQAHLQAITALAVDATSNFLLSASKDSTIHVWSIPSLLSFANMSDAAPLRTFSTHRSEITALVLGHSTSHCNFAVSASKDKTCLIWDYRTGHILRTYLLPGIPLCIALDPADRAVYLGYEDGSLQQLDMFTSSGGHLDSILNGKAAAEPMQPSKSSLWKVVDSSHASVLSMSVCFDGSTVITGHHSGSVLAWDVARGSFTSALTQAPLPAPVNNLCFLPITGFPSKLHDMGIRINDVVKPKFAAFDNGDGGSVPGNYALNAQLLDNLDSQSTDFQTALSASSFPSALLDEGLSELASWGKSGSVNEESSTAQDDGYMALDSELTQPDQSALREENATLKQQLEALRRLQKKSFEKIESLSTEKKALLEREQKRLSGVNGTHRNEMDEDNEEEESSGDEEMG
ncbi:Pre-rRNA-processing IPI3 [Lecanosticta acicola]|uniref:Pre-rRNA-processing protein IPI3 n=1 Tax=Lecanosticta acicola TaxID=111012 RepID=A0AAI8W279_9PEZI|nr:Pre-rRNA-processing IPI3 [Lecanosticta acicola]